MVRILFLIVVSAGFLLSTVYLAGRVAGGQTQENKPRPAEPAVRATADVRPVEPPAEAPQAQAPTPPPAAQQPPPEGTYVQVGAVTYQMAGVVTEALRTKGFQAAIASGPNSDLCRVLVGPLPDTASAARIQAELTAAGFTSFIRARFRPDPPTDY